MNEEEGAKKAKEKAEKNRGTGDDDEKTSPASFDRLFSRVHAKHSCNR